MYIYIVFSATPYRIGRLIRKGTGGTYNHISISLDEELTQMYSFARRYYKTPFYGGFVKESRHRYCPKGASANIRICRLPVTAEQYRETETLLTGMYLEKEKYLYNHLSAASATLRLPVNVRDAYTCVEFSARILRDLGYIPRCERYYSLRDLELLVQPYTIYEGPMPQPQESDIEYYAHKPIPHPTTATLSSITSLFRRLMN